MRKPINDFNQQDNITFSNTSQQEINDMGPNITIRAENTHTNFNAANDSQEKNISLNEIATMLAKVQQVNTAMLTQMQTAEQKHKTDMNAINNRLNAIEQNYHQPMQDSNIDIFESVPQKNIDVCVQPPRPIYNRMIRAQDERYNKGIMTEEISKGLTYGSVTGGAIGVAATCAKGSTILHPTVSGAINGLLGQSVFGSVTSTLSTLATQSPWASTVIGGLGGPATVSGAVGYCPWWRTYRCRM